MCGAQPAIESAKVELAVSAPVGPGRGPPDLVGLRSASVGSKPRSTGPREPSAPERCVRTS